MVELDPAVDRGKRSLPHTSVTVISRRRDAGRGRHRGPLLHAARPTFRALLAVATRSGSPAHRPRARRLARRSLDREAAPAARACRSIGSPAATARFRTRTSRVSEVATVSAALQDMAAALERSGDETRASRRRAASSSRRSHTTCARRSSRCGAISRRSRTASATPTTTCRGRRRRPLSSTASSAACSPTRVTSTSTRRRRSWSPTSARSCAARSQTSSRRCARAG